MRSSRTTNFLHGIPHFAISIGVERDGELVAGVVYEPIRDELFWAERNEGAYLNRRRLRVSERATLSDALLATGIPFADRIGKKSFMAMLNVVMEKTAGVRRLGSAALDLAYVAAGRYEGFWETGLLPWDIAGGIVIVREAGGMVSEIDGRPSMLYGNSIIATNQRLYDPLRKLLMDAIRTEKLKLTE